MMESPKRKLSSLVCDMHKLKVSQQRRRERSRQGQSSLITDTFCQLCSIEGESLREKIPKMESPKERRSSLVSDTHFQLCPNVEESQRGKILRRENHHWSVTRTLSFVLTKGGGRVPAKGSFKKRQLSLVSDTHSHSFVLTSESPHEEKS